ncbi:SDR family oxidoreductase [Dactylosporangium sp. CS-033363]|uniref:SDR family oxidoreductase n=1 Tax=Dactylosporangium sp. CS-033363 TaxID=3239935 RepID=UPI003D9426AC
MRIAVAGGTGTVGRHVVDIAKQAGHDVVVLSRSRGVDVAGGGAGLDEALRGVDVIVDVTNPDTIEREPASKFFTAVSAALQQSGARDGVRHIVTLSIVGVDRTTFGYYQAKLDQERTAARGPVPHTILRATQLHELPAQLMAITRQDSHASVFDVQSRPVAARTVAQVLVELAESRPRGRVADLAGPQEANLVDMAKAFVSRRGLDLTVDPDTQSMSGVPAGALLPPDGARIEGPTYDQWLATEDAAALTV